MSHVSFTWLSFFHIMYRLIRRSPESHWAISFQRNFASEKTVHVSSTSADTQTVVYHYVSSDWKKTTRKMASDLADYCSTWCTLTRCLCAMVMFRNWSPLVSLRQTESPGRPSFGRKEQKWPAAKSVISGRGLQTQWRLAGSTADRLIVACFSMTKQFEWQWLYD